jgi:hypothetical protein
MIQTFETRFGERSLPEHAWRHKSGIGVEGDPSGNHRDDVAVEARVNHGRWIVDCPYCPGAEMARADGFFCCDCRNTDAEGDTLTVQFPAEREEIERLLLVRPVMADRNWRPGESLENLVTENEGLGL